MRGSNADIPVATVATAVPAPEGGSDASQVVLGVPIYDPDTRSQVRRVMATAIAMALLAIITGIISISTSEDVSSGIIASFAIPVCGYLAVKNKSRSCLR